MSAAEIFQRLGNRFRSLGGGERKRRQNYAAETTRTAAEFVAAAGQDPLAYIDSCFASNFFFSSRDLQSIVETIGNEVPEEVSTIIEQADALLDGGLPVLGVPLVADVTRIDWQADPVSSERYWPDDWFDEAQAIGAEQADVKHVWEVNRHQYLFTLGRASRYSGDSRYAEVVRALVDDWIEENPPGPGVNWCSHLEVAVRAISWVWTMPLVLGGEEGDREFAVKWLASIANHYYHLSKNLSVYTDPTNHLIGEATALWMLSVVFPELPEAQRNKALAEGLLNDAIRSQTHADGVNREQATSYHRFVLDFFLQFKILKNKSGAALPNESDSLISKMFEFAAALCGHYGFAPMTGDSDDARGVPFLDLVGWDFRDLLSTGSVLFEESRWKTLGGPLAAVSVWLLGPEGARTYRSFEGQEQTEAETQRFFPDGGYCFMDNVLPDRSAEAIFDCGDLGLWPNAAHGHADALNVGVRIEGRYLIGDPGTGAYFHSEVVRNHFRRTSSHNTVSVGNRDQADLFDQFKWVNPFDISEAEAARNDYFEACTGAHNGYLRLRHGVMHQRYVVGMRGFGWTVIDRVTPHCDLPIARHFQFGPECDVFEQDENSLTVLDTRSQRALNISFWTMGSSPLEVVLSNSVWSESYGNWEPSKSVSVSGKKETCLVTIIQPLPAPNGTGVTQQIVTQKVDNEACEFTIASPDHEAPRVRIIANNKDNKVININDIETNARFLFVARDDRQDGLHLLAVGRNSYAQVSGVEVRTDRDRQFGLSDTG